MLIDFVSYSTVRSILGLSVRELSDETLADDLFRLAVNEDQLRVGESVSAGSDIVADYRTICDAPSATSVAAVKFDGAMRVFTAYATARVCLTALPGLSPAFISDSKVSIKKDQASVPDRVTREFDAWRRKLQVAYAAFLGVSAPTQPQLPYMTVSSPVYDPVVGE